MRRRLVAGAIVLLGGGVPAAAHPAPFSYLDVRLRAGAVDVSVVIHAFDVAHELRVEHTLMKAYTATSKSVDSIVTGHSPVMTPNDLREFAEFNRDFLNTVREGKKNGRSAEDIAGAWTMPERYKGYAPPAADQLRANVENVYKELR